MTLIAASLTGFMMIAVLGLMALAGRMEDNEQA
jgi:hypothetical protein